MIESKNNDWIWRASIFPDWIKKYNQEFYRYRNDPIWKIMFDLTLNKFFLERGYIHFCHPDTEVDDIIAIIVKLLEQTFPDDLITIISQNSDFYQLINDKIIVLNINGEEDTSRILPSGEINLWFKIMNGQRSNYIPSLKFNNEFLKDFLKDDYDEDFDNDKLIKSEDVETVYRELTKKELYVVLHKLKLFQASLDTINDVVKDNQLIINQQIIDFNYIPKNIVTSIKKKFWLAYNKNNQLDQLDNNFGNKKSKEPLGTKLFNNKMLPTNHNIFSYLYVEDDENDNLSEENELSDYEN
jgi:5'-3' exonuclease